MIQVPDDGSQNKLFIALKDKNELEGGDNAMKNKAYRKRKFPVHIIMYPTIVTPYGVLRIAW